MSGGEELTTTPLPLVPEDGGRALAGYVGVTNRDCATRAIAIGTRLPYRVVHDMVDLAGARRGITNAAEDGPPLIIAAELLKEKLRWEPVEHGPRLTFEDLPVSKYPRLIVQTQADPTGGHAKFTTEHLTAVVNRAVRDISSMATARCYARLDHQVMIVYAPPADNAEKAPAE